METVVNFLDVNKNVEHTIVVQGHHSNNASLWKLLWDHEYMFYMEGLGISHVNQYVEDMEFRDIRINYMHKGNPVAFIHSFGSTNYGTRTTDSDSDYVVYMIPSFNDIYKGLKLSYDVKINGNDYKFKDLRMLPSELLKANPTTLELFAAKEYWVSDDYHSLWEHLQSNRLSYGNINLKRYVNGLIGTFRQKMSSIRKDAPNNKDNEGYNRKIKYGFDTKHLLHAVRLHSMYSMIKDGILNPVDAIDLTKVDGLVDRLLSIKNNEDNYTKEDALEFGAKLEEDLNSLFPNKPVNYSLSIELGYLVEELIAKYYGIVWEVPNVNEIVYNFIESDITYNDSLFNIYKNLVNLLPIYVLPDHDKLSEHDYQLGYGMISFRNSLHVENRILYLLSNFNKCLDYSINVGEISDSSPLVLKFLDVIKSYVYKQGEGSKMFYIYEKLNNVMNKIKNL